MENSKIEADEAIDIDTSGLTPDEQARIPEIIDAIKAEVSRLMNKQLRVGVFGDTGVGKSTLCNALFGKEIAATSEVKACTRSTQEIALKGEGQGGIVLVDVPGVGEDPEHHQEYSDLYDRLLPDLDMVLWCIKADDRKYATSLDVYDRVLKPHQLSRPVVFVLTQVDKIEPYREWDVDNNTPGPNQLKNIQEKKGDIAERFDVPRDKIIAVSATEGYNLVELVDLTVRELSNPNKFSFIREVKTENLSEEAVQETGRGMFSHVEEMVLEKAGNAVWNFIKDTAVPTLIDWIPIVPPPVKTVAKKVWGFITSFF